MMLLVLPLAGLLAALLLGGSLARLAALHVRGKGYILAAFALQLLATTTRAGDSGLLVRFGPALYLTTLGLALVGVGMNWGLGWGLRAVGVGLALNATVIAANGGHMPVDVAAMQRVAGAARVRALANGHAYSNTRPASASSRLLALSDVIPEPFPSGHGNVYSAGDVVLATGAAATVYGATRRARRPAGTRSTPVGRAAVRR